MKILRQKKFHYY